MSRYEVRKSSFGSLDAYELTDSVAGIQAVVVPAVGSNMIALRVGSNTRILYEPPTVNDLLETPTAFGFPVLMPPNRIAFARFEVDGRTYVFPKNHGDHHIHGLVHNVEWKVSKQLASDSEGAVLETTVRSLDHKAIREVYPQDFTLTMQYVIKDGEIIVSTSCENSSDDRLPFGIGFHPYFSTPMTPASTKESCFVRLRAQERWVLTNCLPTEEIVEPVGGHDLREFTPVSSLKLDDLYGRVTDRAAVVEDRGSGLRLTIQVDEAYPFWVVWTGKTPDAPFICLEPYTCVTNAFNLKMCPCCTGAKFIEKGDIFRGSIRLTLGTV
ncbi:MAG: aldose 1-epimerase [Firmicutes bacterium]|nr:aldose 1-epimerase [Bacillota bacterium]